MIVIDFINQYIFDRERMTAAWDRKHVPRSKNGQQQSATPALQVFVSCSITEL